MRPPRPQTVRPPSPHPTCQLQRVLPTLAARRPPCWPPPRTTRPPAPHTGARAFASIPHSSSVPFLSRLARYPACVCHLRLPPTPRLAPRRQGTRANVITHRSLSTTFSKRPGRARRSWPAADRSPSRTARAGTRELGALPGGNHISTPFSGWYGFRADRMVEHWESQLLADNTYGTTEPCRPPGQQRTCAVPVTNRAPDPAGAESPVGKVHRDVPSRRDPGGTCDRTPDGKRSRPDQGWLGWAGAAYIPGNSALRIVADVHLSATKASVDTPGTSQDWRPLLARRFSRTLMTSSLLVVLPRRGQNPCLSTSAGPALGP